jgi:serine acetyltransferase
VGAGAVVTKNVEPYAIMAGNPARKIGERISAQETEAGSSQFEERQVGGLSYEFDYRPWLL